MLKSMTLIFTHLSKKYLPDAYIFALILTFIVFISGILFTDVTPGQMIVFWGDGFWDLLSFAMQMALILVFGFTLAKSNMVSRFLKYIAKKIKSFESALIWVCLISSLACYINWGFGLIIGALLSVEIAKNFKKVNYGLLIACSYSGFLFWHAGLSGSIPLSLTQPDSKIKALMGQESAKLHLTMFSHLNLLLLLIVFFSLIFIIFILAKLFKKHDLIEIKDHFFIEENNLNTNVGNKSFADRIARSQLLVLIIFIMGSVYIFNEIPSHGLSLNLMIFILLMLALLFHKNSHKFLFAFNSSIKDCSGIMLQFPFYAGIIAMMRESGLAINLCQFFINISTKETFLFLTYISAGLVNFFIPSGGGQWVLQAPIVLPAAKEMGIDIFDAAMAIAWGDAWSNMIQPFFAIPLLSAAKCDLREMMGYSLIIFLFIGLVTSLTLLIYSLVI